MKAAIRVVTSIVAMLASATCLAAAQRTFVASNGSDLAACSLTAPCRSFGAAIAKTSSGGEIIVLDSAGYGAVTIDKSVSIIAPAGIYAGISVFSGSDGVTVNAPGGTVVLRGLSINGQGGRWGVNLQSAARLRIESCVVSNMQQDGVRDVGSGSELIVLDTIVRDNGDFGFNVIADASVLLDRVHVEHNQGSGFGIVPVSTTASATIGDSAFVHNLGSGIVVDAAAGTTTYVQVESSILSHNSGAGFLGTAAVINAKVRAALTRNAIGRNGADGILLTGSNGFVSIAAVENTVESNAGDGINVDIGMSANISADVVAHNAATDVRCSGLSLIESLANNSVGSSNIGPCYVPVSAF